MSHCFKFLKLNLSVAERCILLHCTLCTLNLSGRDKVSLHSNFLNLQLRSVFRFKFKRLVFLTWSTYTPRSDWYTGRGVRITDQSADLSTDRIGFGSYFYGFGLKIDGLDQSVFWLQAQFLLIIMNDKSNIVSYNKIIIFKDSWSYFCAF